MELLTNVDRKERGARRMTQSAVEFLKKIVKINSVNPPGNELAVAREIQALLEEHCIENELIEFEGGRANLIARLRGRRNGIYSKVLALSGHMDVVPPGKTKWKHGVFSANEVNGRIYGRGTCDMKGGLTALIFAMIVLKNEGVQLNGDLKLLVTAGEEVDAIGAKHLVKAGHMDDVTAIIIAEPTNNEVCIAEKGALWVEITTFGRTAHGSSPSDGINAIEHMRHVLNALDQNFRFDKTPDDLLGSPTYSITTIDGGVKTNVIPDQCKLQIDFRTVPPQNHQDILQQLNEVLRSISHEIADFDYKINVINDMPPVKTNHEDGFVKVTREIAEGFYGEPKEPKGVPYYSDGAILVGPSSNIPLVIFGAANPRYAHQPDECIEIEPFLSSIDFYKLVIQKYLS